MKGTTTEMHTINTSFRSALHHPAPTDHYLHSMKTSEPRDSEGGWDNSHLCEGVYRSINP
ncbi:hypothetical protein F511_29314 [Dorcoceras hygrometricum]|uniref:Uncharacterized protein n=1 Tax=Dorcoceras hygrometricum TaxID=472368 RepID=A0A2Z7C1Q5_9LAMI|nr:hypothetical protein F511_29314 [Dorcoceras hygrometricum]